MGTQASRTNSPSSSLVALAAGLLVLFSGAQAGAIPGDENWSTQFAPQGTNGEVLVTYEQGGNLLIGGAFTSAGAAAANRIVLWDGTSFLAMGEGFNGDVRALVEWNGEIYAGGDFTASGTTPLSYLARWTGSAWVDVGGGAGSSVRALAVFNAELAVGGDFFTAGAGGGLVNCEGVASWDGTTWDGLGSNFGGDFYINDLQVYNGSLMAAGFFITVNGDDSPHLGRYDGTTWSGVGGGLTVWDEDFGETDPWSAQILELDVHNGNLICSGSFNRSGYDDPLDGICTWNGNFWTDIGPGDAQGFVLAMGVVNGTLYMLTQHGTLNSHFSGTLWNFVAGPSNGWPSSIGGYGTDVVLSGDFFWFGGQHINNIMRYDGAVNAVGTGQGLEDYAWRLMNWNGKLVAGGLFEVAGGAGATNKVAAWDGTAWSSLGTDMTSPGFSAVHSMVEFNGDLIVGGSFTSIGGVAANRIARYDGTNWFAMGTGSLGTTTEMAVWNNELYAIIYHTSGTPTVSRWNGTTWDTIGNNAFGGDIYRMMDYGGDLIVAGQITSIEGITINGIARWDGTTWSPFGTGISGVVGPRIWGMMNHGGLLYAVGYFTAVDGTPASYLAVWDGFTWSEFGGGANERCYDIRVFNGDIVVTGFFTSIGGVAADGIARWDGTTWHNMGSGLDNFGRTLGEFDGELFVSGPFAMAGGKAAGNICSWSNGTVSAAPESRIVLGPRAWPNPFGGSTSIFYEMSTASHAVVDVYDIRGRRIAQLHHGRLQAGRNEIVWNGQDDGGRRQPAGTYFVRARSAAGLTTTKVNLIR